MFSINAAVMVPEAVSIFPMEPTGGQCFLLREQHLVLDGGCMGVLQRGPGYGKPIALLSQAVLGIDPLLFTCHSGVAYHTASQVSYS